MRKKGKGKDFKLLMMEGVPVISQRIDSEAQRPSSGLSSAMAGLTCRAGLSLSGLVGAGWFQGGQGTGTREYLRGCSATRLACVARLAISYRQVPTPTSSNRPCLITSPSTSRSLGGTNAPDKAHVVVHASMPPCLQSAAAAVHGLPLCLQSQRASNSLNLDLPYNALLVGGVDVLPSISKYRLRRPAT